jgi:hypothetical protein
MQESDKREFASVLQATMDVYNKEISTDVIKIWWMALNTYPIEQVKYGLSKYITSADYGKFPPKPADIILMMDGSSQNAALDAWNKVMEAISRAGAYKSVCFDDPIIHLAIDDIGGWIGLGETLEKDLPFIQKRFEQSYRNYRLKGDLPAHKRYLIGRSEAQNNLQGYPSDKPILIGDKAKAEETMSLGSDKPRIAMSVAETAIKQLEKLYDDGVPF